MSHLPAHRRHDGISGVPLQGSPQRLEQTTHSLRVRGRLQRRQPPREGHRVLANPAMYLDGNRYDRDVGVEFPLVACSHLGSNTVALLNLC